MNLINNFVPRTTSLQIVEMLHVHHLLSYAQIKRNLNDLHDGTVGRELKRLVQMGAIMKSGEPRHPKYTLNYAHPEMENLLAIIHLYSTRSDAIHVFDAIDDGVPFASLSVISPGAKQMEMMISEDFRRSADFSKILIILVQGILNTKLLAKIFQLMEESKIRETDAFLFYGDLKVPNLDNAQVFDLYKKVRDEDLTIQINSLLPRQIKKE